jgi:hypothetical protein
MLKHAIEWLQMAITVVEGLLLLRVLSLKLHRVYTFITLYCVLNLFFDAVSWYLGWETPEAGHVFIYSLFFFAPLYPLAAWDVFEESKTLVAKLRRLQMIRLASGLFITCVCALLLGLTIEPADPSGNSIMPAFLGVFLLTGSASACAAFLWFMHRFVRTNKLAIAHNTSVWIIFFMLALSLEIVNCLAEFIRALIPPLASDLMSLVLMSLDLAVLAWCILRLRAIPSDVASAPEKASL